MFQFAHVKGGVPVCALLCEPAHVYEKGVCVGAVRAMHVWVFGVFSGSGHMFVNVHVFEDACVS